MASAPVRQLLNSRVSTTSLVAAALAAVIGYFAVGVYVALVLARPQRQRPSTTPAAYGLSYRDVTFRSRDGLALAGWFIPAPGSERAIIMVHGMSSCRSAEFEGRFVECAARLQDEGFNVLMIDLRGHGESEGRHLTFGVREGRDVLGAADWLRAQGFRQIGLLGVSLGAASAVAAITAGGSRLIGAVVLDSPFADLRDLLDRHFAAASGIPLHFLPGSLLMGRLLLGVDFNAVRPARALVGQETPLLLIFGAQDDIVPVGHFRAMCEARPDAGSWLVEGAGHAAAYSAGPDEYITRVSRFFHHELA